MVEECRPLHATKSTSQLIFTDIVNMYRHIVSLLTSVTVTDIECRRVLFDRQTTLTGIISLLAVANQGNPLSFVFHTT